MDRLAYLTAMALLGIGLTMAQNTKPRSDPSNSSNAATQAQSSTTANGQQSQSGRVIHGKHRSDRETAVPNPAVNDQQNSTTDTTGVSGENPQPSNSTMGTSGSTPGRTQHGNPAATMPQTAPPADQQPNSSTSPNASPHAKVLQTPAARAAATHTPDPGTCMNPAALEDAQSNNQSRPCN